MLITKNTYQVTSPTDVSWVRRERKPELKSERSNGLSSICIDSW